jgi:hypothetical protein
MFLLMSLLLLEGLLEALLLFRGFRLPKSLAEVSTFLLPLTLPIVRGEHPGLLPLKTNVIQTVGDLRFYGDYLLAIDSV